MTLSIFTLISALSISATAAYFSIIGLATMFPGSQGSIIIMGSVLEVGKIIAAIWLHANWKNLSFFIKAYLSFAVTILMLITSMGIFGFLSKSYIVHEAEANKEVAQISQIDNKIAREQDLIKRYEKSIQEIKKDKTSEDSTKVNFITLEESRITKLNEISRASISSEQEDINRWRSRLDALDKILEEIESKGGIFSNKKKKLEEENEKQSEERSELKLKMSRSEENIQLIKQNNASDIAKIQEKIESFQNAVIENTQHKSEEPEIRSLINESLAKIEELEREKFDFEKRVRELEVEVGPVKYIVELFSDLGKKDLGLGTAVRIVIIALIFVFDPLAVLLVVVSVSSFAKKKSIEPKATVYTYNENTESLSKDIEELKKLIQKPKEPRTGCNSKINWSNKD